MMTTLDSLVLEYYTLLDRIERIEGKMHQFEQELVLLAEQLRHIEGTIERMENT